MNSKPRGFATKESLGLYLHEVVLAD